MPPTAASFQQPQLQPPQPHAATTARALSASLPKTRTTAISAVHPLGKFGVLHAGTLPRTSLEFVRAECASTPCDAIHTNLEALLDAATRGLLQQGFHGHITALAKLPDGYACYLPFQQNRLLSLIKDAHLCVPEV